MRIYLLYNPRYHAAIEKEFYKLINLSLEVVNSPEFPEEEMAIAGANLEKMINSYNQAKKKEADAFLKSHPYILN